MMTTARHELVVVPSGTHSWMDTGPCRTEVLGSTSTRFVAVGPICALRVDLRRSFGTSNCGLRVLRTSLWAKRANVNETDETGGMANVNEIVNLRKPARSVYKLFTGLHESTDLQITPDRVTFGYCTPMLVPVEFWQAAG